MKPIEYPTIDVGGKTLVVRCSLAAQILMRRRGIPMEDLPKLTTGAQALEVWLQVFACMVDENFAPDDPSQYVAGRGPTADFWATQIAPGDFIDITRVCNESMGKALEALKEKRAAATPIALAS